MRYASSWLAVDLIAALPIDAIVGAVLEDGGPNRRRWPRGSRLRSGRHGRGATIAAER